MIFKVLETNFKLLKAILKVLKSISNVLKSIFKVLKLEITQIPSVPFVSQVIRRYINGLPIKIVAGNVKFPITVENKNWGVHARP